MLKDEHCFKVLIMCSKFIITLLSTVFYSNRGIFHLSVCCREGIAATASIQQATTTAELNVQFHTETWQPNQGVTEQTDVAYSTPRDSQLHGRLDIHNTTEVTQRSTITKVPGSTMSQKSQSESETLSSTTQALDGTRNDTTDVTNSDTETLMSSTEAFVTNVVSSARAMTVTSVTDVASPTTAVTYVESTTHVVSSSNVSSTKYNVSTTSSDSNISIPNVSPTNVTSNLNVTLPNESSSDIVSSTNDHSQMMDSVTSSLTSNVRMDDNDTVSLKPVSQIETETQDSVTETESDDIYTEATQTSKLDDAFDSQTSASVASNHVTPTLRTVESRSSTMLTSPSANVHKSKTAGPVTSVAIATTSSSFDVFHPPTTGFGGFSRSTSVTMDTSAVVTTTDNSLAETSLIETTTVATVDPSKAPPARGEGNESIMAPSASASTVLTSRKPPTTVSILDKFKKPPKTRLEIKIADSIPTRVAALPTEKSPNSKNPIKSPDAPPVKHTTPAISTTTPSATPTPTPWVPTVYVTLGLKMSWGEFCTNFREFQEIIAKLLMVEMKKPVKPDQVRLLENAHCAARTARSVQIAVGVYVFNPKGIYDFEMSNVLVRLIQDDQNRRFVGSSFEDKVSE